MYTTQIAKNCQTKKISMKNIEMYKPLPVVNVNSTCCSDNKKNEMVALFMDSCFTTSGSCVQSRLLGPSDTYSATSSQRGQSRLFHPLSDSSSFTDSTHSQWVLPPYTPTDYRHYTNVPVYKPTVSVLFFHWFTNNNYLSKLLICSFLRMNICWIKLVTISSALSKHYVLFKF